MIRIVLADDHAIVREGLRQLMMTTADIQVVGEAGNFVELQHLCQRTAFDVLLLDMTMPGLSGIELIQRLVAEMPSLPILVLSMHIERQIVTQALKVGASGYVAKGSLPETLFVAIRKLADGAKYIDPLLVNDLVFDASDSDEPGARLSLRELQVLGMIAAGRSLGDIADRFHLSPKTISSHKIRLMQKLNIDNNADLIRYATQHMPFEI
ncbi:MAG: response regulator transcription factor [Proteobacteria bacterium]|nr:response regulator transcription factor [Pseudomonadota bacterium]